MTPEPTIDAGMEGRLKKLEAAIFGNGEPGLQENMEIVVGLLDGDKRRGVKGLRDQITEMNADMKSGFSAINRELSDHKALHKSYEDKASGALTLARYAGLGAGAALLKVVADVLGITPK